MTRTLVVVGIDCGTNSTRLLVADKDGRTIERLLTITRLGRGVDSTGRLEEDAIDRTIRALSKYRSVMDAYQVDSVRAVATSASRDASNSVEFFTKAEKVLGVAPELLTGHQEGELSFLGATHGLGNDFGKCVVVDIGGGSTEIVAGSPGNSPGFALSIDMGCVRITEKYLQHDPPLDEEVENATREIRDNIERVSTKARSAYYPEAFAGHRLIGVAGTVTAMSAIRLGLIDYQSAKIHHSILTRDDIASLASDLAGKTAFQRASEWHLETGRADVIVGGALILKAISEHLVQDDVLVSETDILDGLVISQLR